MKYSCFWSHIKIITLLKENQCKPVYANLKHCLGCAIHTIHDFNLTLNACYTCRTDRINNTIFGKYEHTFF